MMATPRNRLINLNITSYYHCTARCVRRAFLMGLDKYSGRNFDHRRKWLEDLLGRVEKAYSIDILAYSIMENHYHVVLRVDKSTPINWSFREIFQRWLSLHKGEPLVLRYLSGETLEDGQQLELATLAAEYRRRLMSISWFMRELNERIARKANLEDERSGRFWESRYTSQALLDEAAILSCMAYVDLNPVRAGLTKVLENSDFTSIKQRVKRAQDREGRGPVKLLSFGQAPKEGKGDPLQLLTEAQYLSLVDWSGRFARNGKSGVIPEQIEPILARLNIEESEWLIRTRDFRQRFKCVAGFWHSLVAAAKGFKRKWFQGKAPTKQQV